MRKLRFDLSVETNALLCPNPDEFYSQCYISEDIVNNYRTLPGIKNATKIANVVFSNLLKASTCSFSAGDEPLDAVDIDVCALSAMAEVCRFDLETSFLATQMAKGSNSSFEVGSFMNYYWGEMASEIADEIAVLRWQGNTGLTSSYLKECDGLELKLSIGLTASSPVIGITGTSITSSNVIAEMVKVVQALPACLQSKKKDLRFHIASNVATAYELAAAAGNTLTYVTQTLGLTFLGIPIVVNPGMSDGTMVLTMKDNLIYAFDGEADSKSLKAINLEDTVAEPKLRTRANLKVGFYYVNPTEIVFYH